MFLLIATAGSCHGIAAEHDRLPPSISAAAKENKGKFSVLNYFMHL